MSDVPATGEMVDCLVIGGGLAGLSCAHRLVVRGSDGARAGGRGGAGRPGADRVASRAPGGPGLPGDVPVVSARAGACPGGGYPESGSPAGGRRSGVRQRRGVRAAGRVAVRAGRFQGDAAGRPGAARALRGRGRAAVGRGAARRRTRMPRPPRTCCGRSGSRIRRSRASCRPLFGVITLDRTLSADPGYFRFLVSMLVRGPSVIPSDGLGMLAEWTSASVRQQGGVVELGARVVALEAGPDDRQADGRAAGGRAGA